MTTWTNDELNKIENTDELQISSLRTDGTLRKPVIIWVVRVADDLYVRSYTGRTAHWYRGAQVRHEGHIRCGGVAKDVTFVDEADPGINDRVDAAYRSKYARYAQYVAPMLTAEVRSTTIKLVPRSEAS